MANLKLIIIIPSVYKPMTFALLAPRFTSWTTRTLLRTSIKDLYTTTRTSIKDFNAQGLCMVKVCYVFVMNNLPHGLKKTRQQKKWKKFNPCGLQYVWKLIIFGFCLEPMNLNLCTVQGCALVWQTSVQLQCHTDNQWLQLEMSIHLAHSFIFSPAWKQHHKCLKGTLISSEGVISKQRMRGAFQINFRWTKLSEYRRSTSYW